MGFGCTQNGVPRNRALDRAASASARSSGDRGTVERSPWRHAVAGRLGRIDRGGPPLPLARARAKPPRSAAALCQLAGAGGKSRASDPEAGRSSCPYRDEADHPGALRCQSSCAFRRRALPPQEVARWLVATRDARLQILGSSGRITGWPPNRAYRKAHRDLVMMLAKESRSPGARNSPTFRRGSHRRLSQKPARRRLGRSGRRNDADSKIANSRPSSSSDFARLPSQNRDSLRKAIARKQLQCTLECELFDVA